MIIFGSLTSFLWTTFIPKSKNMLNNNDATNSTSTDDTTTNVDDSTTTEDEENAENDSRKSKRSIKNTQIEQNFNERANDNITWWRHYNSKSKQ